MKAAEILRRYAAGERNFQRVDIRGQSFKGADLSGADFSEADIRSTNFKNANLQGVNFTEAKAGLQKRWVAFLLFISFLLSGISGSCYVFLAAIILLLFDNNDSANFYIGLFSLIILVIFLIITIRKGILAGIVAVVGAVAVIIIGAGAIARAGIGGVGVAAGAGAFAGTIAVTGAVAIVIASTIACIISKTFAKSVIVCIPGVVIASVVVSRAVEVVFTGALAVAVTVILFGFYLTWRTLKGDKRDTWLRSFAVAFTAIGGTNFRGTNLTDIKFVGTTLKNTDFRKATLTRTNFRNAKKLDLARPGTTYLNNLQLQPWLTGTGQDNNFDRQILQGVNLQGKILTDASFIDADLSEANLQDADLSRAKLVQTELNGTDFTGATLTGAYIEDWGITSSTVLNGVRCEYIFMRLPTKENPDPRRKPDNFQEVFKDGDFKDFIKPISDTLDLYHNHPVDPRAIALSWKKLVEKYPDTDLKFTSMEVKGENNLLLRLKTVLDADKSQLSAEYFEEYNRIKALNEEYVKQLAKQDEEIKLLVIMIAMGLQSPNFQIQGDYIEGDKIDQSRTFNISDSTIENTGAAGFGLGDISGTTANEINQPPPPNSENS